MPNAASRWADKDLGREEVNFTYKLNIENKRCLCQIDNVNRAQNNNSPAKYCFLEKEKDTT